MKYSMVASDYDGTLMPSTRVISCYTKSTVERYVAAGGTFVICSGRMFYSIRNEAKALGLHGIAICYQGALIKDMDSGHVYDMTAISPDLAVEYVEFMKKLGATPQVYVDDTLNIESKNPFTDAYAEYCRVTPNIVGNLSAFLGKTTLPINKVYCHVKEEMCAEIRAAAAEQFAGRLMISSSGPLNVEAVDIKASKGKALIKLAEISGIDISSVMAFGDNLNDIDLVKTAGFGVAVGNAVPELKKYAKYVSENCENDGVAKTVEKFCLTEENNARENQ